MIFQATDLYYLPNLTNIRERGYFCRYFCKYKKQLLYFLMTEGFQTFYSIILRTDISSSRTKPAGLDFQYSYIFIHYFIFQVNNLLAIGFFIICIFLVVLPIIDDPQLVGVALGIMASGVPIYIFFIHWKNKPAWLKNIVHTWDVAVQKVFLAIPTE